MSWYGIFSRVEIRMWRTRRNPSMVDAPGLWTLALAVILIIWIVCAMEVEAMNGFTFSPALLGRRRTAGGRARRTGHSRNRIICSSPCFQ